MITPAEAARATGGEWLAAPLPLERPLGGGCIDTRSTGEAEIFFALKGERADGHDFLAQLAGGGVRLAVVGRNEQPPEFRGNVLRVADPLKALGEMGAFLVRKYHPKIVAITGSYGKTTAKETIAHVIGGELKVLKTPGSHNNEVGLPLALLGLDGSHDAAVLEFSARNVGDIDYLGAIAPPDVALLIAVGRAHIGIFGSQEAIYRAKGELFNHLRPGGLAVVGAQDPRLRELAGEHRTVTFGAARGDFRAEELWSDTGGRQRFLGVNGRSRLSFSCGVPGAHGFYPVLAAWAVARELGVADETVVARAGFDPGHKGRSSLLRAPGGAAVLDDTYNASPETVVNIIATLGSIQADERILVLGHLSELEEGLEQSAAIIGGALAPPIDRCFVHAPHTPGYHGLLRSLATDCPVVNFDSRDELIAELRALDQPGRLMGFKGARSAHLERVVQGLLGVRVTCGLTHCGLLRHCTGCEQMRGGE